MRDLEKKEAAQLARLKEWQAKAAALVNRKLDDAAAHAIAALTTTLKKTPEGRPTVRKAAQSRSFAAAVSRLDELWAALTGPSVASLDGLVRDAREDLYRFCFTLWRPLIPPELLASGDPKPAVTKLVAARRLVLHGTELRQELQGPFDAAKRTLLATLAQAGQRSTPEHIETDLIDTWRRQTETAVTAAVNRALSDSEVRLNQLAGRDLVHPDFRDDEPPEYGP